MKTKIWENQSTLIFDGDITKEEAVNIAKAHHNRSPGKFHEIHRHDSDYGGYIGVAQWAPGDCEHQWPKAKCPYCQQSGGKQA